MLALAALCVLVAAAAWVLTPRPEADGGAGGGGGTVPEQGAPSVLAPAAPSSSERFLADLERGFAAVRQLHSAPNAPAPDLEQAQL